MTVPRIDGMGGRRDASVRWLRAVLPVGAALLLAGGGYEAYRALAATKSRDVSASPSAVHAVPDGEFELTAQQLRGLTIEPVRTRRFQPTRTADGKIAINENKSTPVFSQFSSARVVRTDAETGDVVEPGAPLLEIETPDMVQGGNDLTAAAAALSKAQSQLRLAQSVEARQHELYAAKAAALKDWQQAQADLAGARNDLRAAEITLAAVRNRLAILGKTRHEIAALEASRTIDPTTMIRAPIGGVVVQRKVGPGQYLTASMTDPVYVLGDLSTVWLLASVKETDVPFVKVGQAVAVQVLAYPERSFAARIVSVGSTIDPTTRRLQVRAEVENPDQMLKPEMFASFAIAVGADVTAPAVPVGAIVFEGERAHVWVAAANDRFAARTVELGVRDDRMVQVVTGLRDGDKVVTRGSLFIDRSARAD
jgi:cobalt-zinc-cadmium efflux system membrane fusion protein